MPDECNEGPASESNDLGIPKEWLRRKLTETEAAFWKQKFADQMQPGDELWDFDCPEEDWEHLIGDGGVALVRSGEIITYQITRIS